MVMSKQACQELINRLFLVGLATVIAWSVWPAGLTQQADGSQIKLSIQAHYLSQQPDGSESITLQYLIENQNPQAARGQCVLVAIHNPQPHLQTGQQFLEYVDFQLPAGDFQIGEVEFKTGNQPQHLKLKTTKCLVR